MALWPPLTRPREGVEHPLGCHLSTAWPWGLCYTALLGWEKLLKVQIPLRVVMQPRVHLIAELAVHLPVNNSVAGGHFLLLASFPHL